MQFNAERAALVLLDALVLGDARAAEKWEVTERTIQNYRARLAADPHFSRLFADKKRAAEAGWSAVRLRFLRKSIAKLEELVEKATDPKFIPAVADAVKVVGELQIASDALSVPECDQPGAEPAEAPAVDPGGSGAVH